MRKSPKMLLVGLTMLIGLWASTARSQAAEELAAAAPLTTAPAGLNQLEKIFVLPSSFANGVTNAASIQKVTNADAPNTQAIEVNSAKKQLGGAWSTDANRLDLNKNATIKLWAHFGASSSKAGDGLALVLQNDPNGTQAASSYTKKTIIGETMGVWGVDNDTDRTESADLAATGIQNSWALEFDTYANTSMSFGDAGSGTSFDAGIKGQHIATGYPGSADQYIGQKASGFVLIGIWGTRRFFTQTHFDPKPNQNLTDGQWHHLTLQWDASAKTMTYIYNDVNPDGTETENPVTHVEVINTDAFHSEDGKVRWGITGTNGSNAGNSLVVFESIPNLVDAKAAVKVTDLTKEKPVITGSKVKANDELQYDYSLTYNDGQQDWENIQAKLDLPEHVTFTSVKVAYANGSEQTVDIPAGETKTFRFELAQALSKDNPTAKITLKGKANNVSVNGNTTATTSTFTSNNFKTKTTAPDYTITVDQLIELFLIKGGVQTVAKGEDAKVTGLVVAEDSEQLDNSKITVYPTLNGKALPDFKMSNADESGLFTFTAKADDLNVGKNTLEFYVVDDDENESAPATATITVKSGALGFKTVAETSRFKTVTLDGTAKLANRDNDWNLVVADERGTGSSWQLQASVTDFANEDGQKLPGKLIYKQDGTTTTINSEGTVIDSHKSTSDTDHYDVTKKWNDDAGMFFETNAGAVPGAYAGTVTWTLSNAPS